MNKNIFKLLLVGSFAISVQPVDAKKCKKFKKVKTCILIVKKCLSVNGTLFLNGAVLNNLIGLANAIGPAGATGDVTGLDTLVSSIIPYASGVITLGSTAFPAGIPSQGLVMGFGSSNAQTTADPGVTVTNTSFAFSVPEAGTLHDLRVSIDSIYAIGAPSTPFTFTFTILRSSCTSGALTPYTSTGLSATASTTAPAGPITILTAGGAGCGSSDGSITVSPGDRIVLQVTPNAAIPATTLATLALSAGVMYSPAT